jgi:8-hydroxy-5-deazaflavin:NADPH oxidoreductase
MNIAVLGTGAVAQVVVPRLAAAGQRVTVASRTPDAAAASRAGVEKTVSYVAAIDGADLVITAVPGAAVVEALSPHASALRGKIVMDLTNAISPTADGFELLHPNDSVGEAMQRALPGARVVKAMNSMSAMVIADPTGLGEPVNVFVAGDDTDAKATVTRVLVDIGWPAETIIDLGGIANARDPEHVFLLLGSLSAATGTPRLGLAVVG